MSNAHTGLFYFHAIEIVIFLLYSNNDFHLLSCSSAIYVSLLTALMSDIVQEIKSRLDIAEVLRGYIKLIPAGKNLKALCPFHKEKSPSFMVSPERGSWHCFGCGEGGDIFTFVMKYENVEFFEAMKVLAEKAGVTVTSGQGAGNPYRDLYDANRAAKDFFAAQLMAAAPSAHQASAIAYLKERGLAAETIREFEIGLAPAISDGLFRALTMARHAVSAIERAGLVFKSERGTYWDRFRSRIMFPLYNNIGKVVGFTGRALPSTIAQTGFESAKYINSPETPIFNKSKILYGFHKAKSAIRDTKIAIVVEGQMDFLMMWQDGIKNVVASSGTALTMEHLQTLRRLADHLILSFDSDEAGQNAAERSIDLAQRMDFNVSILTVTGYKDPAEVVQAAPGKMAEFVARAVPAMRHYFNRYIVPGQSVAEQKKNIRVVLGKIRQIASPVERLHWVRELALLSGVTERALIEEMDALKAFDVAIKKNEASTVAGYATVAATSAGYPFAGPSSVSSQVNAAQPQAFAGGLERAKTRSELVSERVLGLLCAYPDLRAIMSEAVHDLAPDDARLFAVLTDAGFTNVPEDLRARADLISLRSGLFADLGVSPEEELRRLMRELRVEALKKRQVELKLMIARYDAAGEEMKVNELSREFDSVAKELHTMKH